MINYKSSFMISSASSSTAAYLPLSKFASPLESFWECPGPTVPLLPVAAGGEDEVSEKHLVSCSCVRQRGGCTLAWRHLCYSLSRLWVWHSQFSLLSSVRARLGALDPSAAAAASLWQRNPKPETGRRRPCRHEPAL